VLPVVFSQVFMKIDNFSDKGLFIWYVVIIYDNFELPGKLVLFILCIKLRLLNFM